MAHFLTGLIRSPRSPTHVLAGALLCASSVVAARAASGQATTEKPATAPAAAPTSAATSGPTSAPTGAPADAKPSTVEKRPPLLREGSFLNRAVGTLREDPARAEWFFVPDAVDPSGLERSFVLQPNGVLEEAIRVERVAPEPLAYEFSGEVFVYKGRNYLLASIATPVVPRAVPSAPISGAGGDRPRGEPDRPLAELDEEALAAELERRLAERIGAAPMTPLGPERPSLEGSEAAPPRRGAMPADVRIQSRRGNLLRDSSTGGWRFVFVGQLPEGGEPSMPVMPCLALERVERLVRESDRPVPLLVSGTTTLFEGRNFLLPTAFRMASGGKGIDP